MYRLVSLGDKEVREYPVLNHSPLFSGLFPHKIVNWQEISYKKFLEKDLRKLFSGYFPANFKDYNNQVFVSIDDIEINEPEISEKEAISFSLTWSYSVSFLWKVIWNCKRMQIKILSEEDIDNLKKDEKEKKKKAIWSFDDKDDIIMAESISLWARESFKIDTFSLLKTDLDVWKIEEKGSKLSISITITERNEGVLVVKFDCHQEKRIPLCFLPKISRSGNFIINGHRKAIVFQSVRAPSIYHFFSKENDEFYTEIIPFKGPWISISYSKVKASSIELRFLNSGLVINFLDILKTFSFPKEKLVNLFSPECLNIDKYDEARSLEMGINFPRFLFTKKNSYFKMGRLGRKKFNSKIAGEGFFSRIIGKNLAEDLLDTNGELIFKKSEIIDEEKISILKRLFKEDKLNLLEVPHSSSKIFSIKLEFLTVDENDNPLIKNFFAIGNNDSFNCNEEKDYLDLADLICVVSSYVSLHYDCGVVEKTGAKDSLNNQFIRRVGDLFYNIFDNKLGSFLQSIDNKYLAYISQLRKVDLLKIPSLGEFEKSFKNFSNVSVLVQLLNENNPWSENSHMQKVSVLGYGGFNDKKNSGATLDARNANHTYAGRYDLVETPEGPKVGLIHYLTSSCRINDYGQLEAPYYAVKNGTITSSLVYFDSEEEYDKYITHPNIRIDKDNRILDSEIPSFYKGKIVIIPREKVEYIYGSFYQLNSFSTSGIPFFENSDPTRTLMAANLKKQAVPTFSNEEPLILSGVESALFSESSLTIRSDFEGEILYVDSEKIILKKRGDDESEITYSISQLSVSNKNILNFSKPLVKKGDFVKSGQPIACGNYFKDGILSLGYNLKVAYMCWNGFNYEDAIILSERLVKNDIFTYFFAKKHIIIRKNTKYGEEIITKSISNSSNNDLDDDGIVKIGTKVKGGDILVGKLTPQPTQHKESEEELLLLNILGTKSQRFINSSLYLPKWENGVVYDIKRRNIQKGKGKSKKSAGEIEIIEIYVSEERRVEVGDKLTTRFGNKGVVAKIVKESDMPFNEKGEIFDIILNPLGVPSRMNVGQLLETILAKASKKLNTNFLFKPFNSPSIDIIEEIIDEAKIEDFGSEKLFDGLTGIPYDKKVYTGYIYTFLLNHKVADKFHSRNVGPRSLITQQPLKGRANDGAMRAGEMEISVLASHGAKMNISSLLGPKSDDIQKRRLYRDSIIYGGKIDYDNNKTESFNRILQSFRGIGFDLKAFDEKDNEINFYEYYSGYKMKELNKKGKKKEK